MVFEVVVGVVFQNEPAAGLQDFVCEDDIRNTVQVGQGVGWASEDVIELLRAVFYEFENVHSEGMDVFFDAQAFGRLLHKLHCRPEFINISYIPASPGDEFITVAPRATEEVQHFYFIKVKAVLQNVEKGLFGEVGSGPGGPLVSRWMKTPPLELSSYYPHKSCIC